MAQPLVDRGPLLKATVDAFAAPQVSGSHPAEVPGTTLSKVPPSRSTQRTKPTGKITRDTAGKIDRCGLRYYQTVTVHTSQQTTGTKPGGLPPASSFSHKLPRWFLSIMYKASRAQISGSQGLLLAHTILRSVAVCTCCVVSRLGKRKDLIPVCLRGGGIATPPSCT